MKESKSIKLQQAVCLNLNTSQNTLFMSGKKLLKRKQIFFFYVFATAFVAQVCLQYQLIIYLGWINNANKIRKIFDTNCFWRSFEGEMIYKEK